MIPKNEVKYIQSLAHQKNRNADTVFLAEGVRLVNELLHSCPNQIVSIYSTASYLNTVASIANHISVREVEEDELERISHLQTPNQVLAVVRQFDFPLPEKDYNEWIIALDGIQDPGNMGTIIRLADWFGIRHVLCSMNCVDIYNTKVVQATMGSIARVGVHYVVLQDWLQNYTKPLIGAMLDGEALNSFQFPDAGMIVVGSEGKGISHEVASLLSRKITIPAWGEAESLNAGVATGILLWELKRK